MGNLVIDKILGPLIHNHFKNNDARYLKLDASNDPITGELEIDNSLLVTGGHIFAGGAYTENTTTAGFYAGGPETLGTPRFMLADGIADRNWQIDNNGGTMRFFTPAETHLNIPRNSQGYFRSGMVLNENGADIDSRIEGDTDENLLFIDAGEDRVGVGTATPSTQLHITGNLTIGGDDLFMATNTANYFLMADGTNYNPTSPANARTGLDVYSKSEVDTEIDNDITTHAAINNAHHNLVTLAGSYDYLTLSNQQITLNQIDLTTDVTGVLPDTNVADDITLTNITQITNRSHTNLSDIGTNTHGQIDTHIGSTSNPHSVIASQATIADSGGYYTGTEVETALQEIGAGTTLDTRYIKKSPGSITDNTILIPDATYNGLIIKGVSGQSANIFEINSSGGSSGNLAFVDSDGNVDLSQHLAIGGLASINAGRVINLVENVTSNSGSEYGFYDLFLFSPTASFSTNVYGAQYVVGVQTAQTRTGGAIYGTSLGILVNNSRDARDLILYGGYYFIDVEDAGSGGGAGAATAASLRALTPLVDTGSCTNGYGLKIEEGTVGTGSITNLYGIHLTNIDNGINSWAIYTNAGSCFFNAGGDANTDFTVKSDSYDALFIDASNDSIDIMHNASGKIGFYAAAPITQAVLATGAGASVDDVITALQNLGLVKQS